MRNPEDMTFGQRFLITIIIVLVILFGLAFIGWATGRWDEAPAQSYPPLEPSAYDQRLLDLDREAIEAAYKDQIMHLFVTWMKDSTDQPRRAVSGARNARKAFLGAMSEIDKRQQR